MTIAGYAMIPECARTAGNATPINTKNPVQNFPKSRMAFPPLSTKSSGLAHRPHIQFGNGARTYVKTTRRGRYCFQSAHDKITRRKPTARTNDKAIIVLRPGAIAAKGFERATFDIFDGTWGWTICDELAEF